MSDQVISPVGSLGLAASNNKYLRMYQNPHFDYLSEMLPTDIKEAFQWCEVVMARMPIIANGVRKLVSYPVTDFSCVSPAEGTREKTKELLAALRMKSVLMDFGTDHYVYGNVFRSVYFPIKRFLRCRLCGAEVAIRNASFKIRNRQIWLKCPCKAFGPADIEDKETWDLSGLRIIRWNPKNIELRQNPITGRTTYYYELPKEVAKAVLDGDLTIVEESPRVFLEAALAGKNIKLGGNFHHARTSSLAGYSSGWGVSPLIPALKNYMYIAVLRRASEAIGMEHITPQRILFPQMSGTTDPSLLGSMERWREEVTTAVNKWRVDPNFVATAPFPTGVVNIGSQGRALIPTEEIKDARMEMALALDINPALLTGDMTIQGSAVSLRILEHQLMPLIESLEAFTNWVISSINTKYEKDFSQVTLVPFKLADDLMNKQLLFQSLSLGSVSRRTVQESLSLDAEQERERIFQEQLADHKMQKDVEGAIAKEERNIAAQAKAEEQAAETGGITPYNQQKLIAQAQQIAAQFLGVPYEQRRSMLDQLQNEDYVMWALVSKQLEGMREHQQRQA